MAIIAVVLYVTGLVPRLSQALSRKEPGYEAVHGKPLEYRDCISGNEDNLVQVTCVWYLSVLVVQC